MLAFGGPRSTAASRRDDTARARKLRVIARKHDPGRLGYRTAVGCWWRRRPSYFSQTARRRPHLLPRHEVFRWTPLSVMLAFGFGLALTYNAAVPGAVTRRRGGREASLLTPLSAAPILAILLAWIAYDEGATRMFVAPYRATVRTIYHIRPSSSAWVEAEARWVRRGPRLPRSPCSAVLSFGVRAAKAAHEQFSPRQLVK